MIVRVCERAVLLAPSNEVCVPPHTGGAVLFCAHGTVVAGLEAEVQRIHSEDEKMAAEDKVAWIFVFVSGCGVIGTWSDGGLLQGVPSD